MTKKSSSETEKIMRKISDSTIRRLSRYFRSLEQLVENGIETVSSDRLAEMDSITSAQVRKDLSFFGTFGKRGLGYNTSALKNQIGEILGLGREWRVAIMGAGNIGRALVNYVEFKKQGFNVCLIMDSNPAVIGTAAGNLKVCDTREVKSLIGKEKIEIGIIAVPKENAQQAADALIDCGIRAILNFAPISLKVPDDVQIKNENTTIEIEALSYYLANH